jgi:hypothetical protein
MGPAGFHKETTMWDLKVLKVAGIVLIGGLLASPASAATAFGSKLGHEPTPPEICRTNNATRLCTWILTIGHANVGHERAPKNGIVAKLRLRSCTPGTFILQIARANTATEQGRVIRTGPLINYKGNQVNCNGGAFIETFNVNVPVQTGDSLAIVANRVGFIYNASGDGTLLFDLPLPDGGPFRAATQQNTGAGILLLQALYND